MARSADPEVARYLGRVLAVPALGREEEAALARAFLEDGDQRAGDRVIQANLRHVVPMALRLRHRGVALEELIAQGNLALVAALRRFDPARGVRFATYAGHWVRAELLALVLRQRSVVGGQRGPVYGRHALQMRREETKLRAQLGDEAAVRRALAQRFERSEAEVAEILLRLERCDSSLDRPTGATAATPAVEQLAPPAAEALDDTLSRARLHAQLARAVSEAAAELGARERYVLEHRLLADAEVQLSLSELGRYFGVSRERARQIEHALKRKLRAKLTDLVQGLEPATAA